MTRFGFDYVHGEIIGEVDTSIRGSIYCEDRHQTDLTVQNETELKAKAAEWLEEHGGKIVYPHGADLRIYERVAE